MSQKTRKLQSVEGEKKKPIPNEDENDDMLNKRFHRNVLDMGKNLFESAFLVSSQLETCYPSTLLTDQAGFKRAPKPRFSQLKPRKVGFLLFNGSFVS